MLLVPFETNVPITVNGILLKRTTFPIGSSPLGNRLSMTVCPSTHTLAEVLTSCSVKMLPLSILSCRISR